MENKVINREPKTNNNQANQTQYYVSLAIAVVIGVIGVFIRFVPDIITSLDQQTFLFSTIANVALAIAAYLTFKCVFKIIGVSK